MRRIAALICLLILIISNCHSGDYRGVKMGIYTDPGTEIRLNNNLANLFEDYSGGQPINFFLTGSRRSFMFEERVAGLSTVTITGPFGVLYTHHFNPPVPSTGIVFLNAPPGLYKFQSSNVVGQITEIKVKVAQVEPVLLMEKSYITADDTSNGLNLHIETKSTASEGINNVELFKDGTVVAVEKGNGSEQNSTFNIKLSPTDKGTTFILQLSDLKTNYRQIRFTVNPSGIYSAYHSKLSGSSRIYLQDLNVLPEPSKPWRTIPKSKKYVLHIANGISLIFADVTNPGEVSLTWTTTRPPNGYKDAYGAAMILKAWNGLKYKRAWISIDYRWLSLLDDQAKNLKFVRADNPREGLYPEMSGTNSVPKQRITFQLKGFGKYLLIAPEFTSTKASRSKGTVNRLPEIELLSGATLKAERFDLASSTGQKLIKNLKAIDLLPVSHVYSIWPESLGLEPSGVLTMRYSDRIVSELGVGEDSLALYGLNLDGDYHKLPYLTLNKDKNFLTARVPRTHPLFAIIGSSKQAENQPPLFYPDGIPPTSSIAFSGPQSGEYISTRTLVVLTAKDAQVPDVLTSGLSGIYYVIQCKTISDQNIELSTYTQPFTLPEGETTLTYMSQDKAQNYEFPKVVTLHADGTPPKTTAVIAGRVVNPEEKAELAESEAVNLVAADPASNGVSSGIRFVFYTVDAPPESSRAAGRYSAPIKLSNGLHTLYYFSTDKVGNMETVKTLYLTVKKRRK